MKQIITICAECKIELHKEKKSLGASVEKAIYHLFLNPEVLYSHGICYECGVKLYGAELMNKVVAKC
jgi:hypothetical protein